jgi:hypothetical protein
MGYSFRIILVKIPDKDTGSDPGNPRFLFSAAQVQD